MKRKPPVPSIVITFHTTAEAMATEKTCREHAIPGKLISAPRALTADCGIAWAGPVETELLLKTALEQNQIEWDGFHHLDL